KSYDGIMISTSDYIGVGNNVYEFTPKALELIHDTSLKEVWEENRQKDLQGMDDFFKKFTEQQELPKSNSVSKPESQVFNVLKSIFPDAVQSYKISNNGMEL